MLSPNMPGKMNKQELTAISADLTAIALKSTVCSLPKVCVYMSEECGCPPMTGEGNVICRGYYSRQVQLCLFRRELYNVWSFR